MIPVYEYSVHGTMVPVYEYCVHVTVNEAALFQCSAALLATDAQVYGASNDVTHANVNVMLIMCMSLYNFILWGLFGLPDFHPLSSESSLFSLLSSLSLQLQFPRFSRVSSFSSQLQSPRFSRVSSFLFTAAISEVFTCKLF